MSATIAAAIPKTARKAIRAAAKLSGRSYPIKVVGGHDEPKLAGEPFHWVTPGGKPVSFPSAYRRAWGKPVYVASTLRIEVGVAWLLNKGLVEAEAEAN